MTEDRRKKASAGHSVGMLRPVDCAEQKQEVREHVKILTF